MGEISEQIINGEICRECLKPIKNNIAEVPVVCIDCWTPDSICPKEVTDE